MEEVVALETYPSYYLEDGKTPNPDYDHQAHVFVVPRWWLASKVKNIGEFFATYTWDETILLYDDAYEEGAVLHEEDVNWPIVDFI